MEEEEETMIVMGVVPVDAERAKAAALAIRKVLAGAKDEEAVMALCLCMAYAINATTRGDLPIGLHMADEWSRTVKEIVERNHRLYQPAEGHA